MFRIVCHVGSLAYIVGVLLLTWVIIWVAELVVSVPTRRRKMMTDLFVVFGVVGVAYVVML